VTPVFAATLVGLGFAGALAAGLVGVGGAVLMIPLLYYVPPALGVGVLEITQVTGVTMAQVLAAALVGTMSHGAVHMVHRRLARIGGASMAAGSFTGALSARYVGGRVLLAVFGAMGLVALALLLMRPSRTADSFVVGDLAYEPISAVAYPAVIGVLSGLVGAGGAFLLVPVLTGVMGLPLRVGIGTSLAITLVSAAAGFAGKLLTGQVPLGPTLAVVAGSLGGAAVGARLSRRAPAGLLRAALAVMIALATVRIWTDVLAR
jgi:uncharacterized membrane protein YfcA